MATYPSRRVVITGAGLISPLGNTLDQFWQALAQGQSGVRELKSLPLENLPTRVGGEAWEFTGRIEDFGPLDKAQQRAIRKGIKVMCREIQMGVAAAQLALADAGWTADGLDPDRSGIVYGSDYILTTPDEFTEAVRACRDSQGVFQYDQWATRALPQVTPLWLLKYLPNMPASHIAIFNDLRGPNNSLTVREASSNLALAEATATISRGHADVMLAGATGTRVHPLRTLHVALQEQLAAGQGDPATISRPFDQGRTGMVVAEGAGALVLEDLDTARKRSATIWGEVVGYGSSAVASLERGPDLRAALRNAMRQCLHMARVSLDEVGHVHAHGLSTEATDVAEAAAILDVFARRSEPIPVVAAKSNYGNPGAAGGLLEAVASLAALRDGKLFPVLNYERPDPRCPLNVVIDRDTPSGNCFLSVNVSPQAQASAVLIRSSRVRL